MNIWMIHHGGFFNRGCEAIVQSTVELIRGAGKEPVTFYLVSQEAEVDRATPHPAGLVILDARATYRPWHLLHALWRRPGWGRAAVRALVRAGPWRPDLVLSIGGDNYTPEYGDPRTWLTPSDDIFLSLGIPMVIWGASVGPFPADTEIGRAMTAHFRRMRAINVREQESQRYLESIGLGDRLVRVWDPAFLLPAQPPRGPTPAHLGEALGLNASALSFMCHGADIDAAIRELAAFIRKVTGTGMPVVLIPHVYKDGLDLARDDRTFLRMVRDAVPDLRDRVTLVEGDYRASELKWIISQCRFFIGARTHGTIAAFSTGVPTIAISYSTKAIGIARDLFGNDRWLVPSGNLTADALFEKFRDLSEQEAVVRRQLADRKPDMIAGARRNLEALARATARP